MRGVAGGPPRAPTPKGSRAAARTRGEPRPGSAAAPASHRRQPLVDGQEVGPAPLREIEWERPVALGPAAQPAWTEEQAAPGIGVEVLDGRDHRLLEGRVQQAL